MEVTGILKAKLETQKVSDRFQKREFVLTTDSHTPYPQYITFQLTQDKCSLLDQYNDGDEMKVLFNLRGREWNGPQGIKYFNTLEAWRIEKSTGGNSATASSTTSNTMGDTGSAPVFTSSASDDNDDLPF